jgi:predicted phosphohydrolase
MDKARIAVVLFLGNMLMSGLACGGGGEPVTKPTPIGIYPFSFAVITDLHIGRGFDDYGTPGHDDELIDGQNSCLTYRLADTVNWINSNYENDNIKFLVIIGDISDTAEKSEFLKVKEILGDLKIPYIPLMGNHDVWSFTGDEEGLMATGDEYFQEVFWDSTPMENPQRLLTTFGDSWEKQPTPIYSFVNDRYFYLQNYACSYGEINIICLDYTRRDSHLVPLSVFAEPFTQTNEWLDEHLKEHPGETVIVFSHYPYMVIGGVLPQDVDFFNDVVHASNCNVLSFGGHIHALHNGESYNVNKNFQAQFTDIPVIVTKAMMEPDLDFLRVVTVEGPSIAEIHYDRIESPTAVATDPNIATEPLSEIILEFIEAQLRFWTSGLLNLSPI